MPYRLRVLLLLFGTSLLSATAEAQRAGLWESRVEVVGRPATLADRECMAADLPRRAMSGWPTGCSTNGPVETASGAFVEAKCSSGDGVTLAIRRELTMSDDKNYIVITTNRFERAGAASEILPTALFRAHYVGPCPGPPETLGKGEVGENTRPWTAGAVIMWIVQLLAFIGFVYASIRGWGWVIRRLVRSRYEHAIVANITMDQAGGAHIPVLATFSGVRGLPWWYAVATNNAKPSLVITPTSIDFRVVRRDRRSWEEIERIDVRQAPGTVNLDVTFRGALLTFSANLGSVPLAAHVLSLIPASVPLSDRAVAIKTASA